MKLFLVIVLGFFICSCGKSKEKKNSPSMSEVDTITKQEQMIEKEIHNLLESGLHFARLSNLQAPKRPMTLYCSNTATLNHEKIEKLQRFAESLRTDNQETYLINKMEVKSSVLLQLVQDAARFLEKDPYSTTCPQIYLAIQSS